MPRVKITSDKQTAKKTKNKRNCYQQETLEKALNAIKSNRLSLRKASKQFQIPLTTLHDKIRNKTELGKKTGPATILTEEEEQKLVNWMCDLSKRGFPVTKNMLLDSVQLLVKTMKRKNPFTSGRPGRHWFESFQKRHPQLSLKKSRNLSVSEASITENYILRWFDEISDYLMQKNLVDISPTRIFNCQESAFMLHPIGENVIVLKNNKNAFSIVESNDKECLTALITGNAAGELAPPLVMYPYKRLPASIIDTIPSGWGIGRSDSGWMTAENFFEYITNVFHPWCVKRNIEFPIILYLNSHSSHASLPLSDFCTDHGIEIILLPPNATHLMQPMDTSVFESLKSAWKKTVASFRMANDGQAMKRHQFAENLNNALKSIDFKKLLSHGFEICGLSPFNSAVVDYSVLIKHETEIDSATKDATTSDEGIESTDIYKETLTFFEKIIDNNVIEEFKKTKASNGEWSGEEKYKGFYDLWRICTESVFNEDVQELLVNYY